MHCLVYLLACLAITFSLAVEEVGSQLSESTIQKILHRNLKWQKFMKDFGKKYENANEELKRLKIFELNAKKIEEHNARYEKKLESYKKGINRFADMTSEELKKYFGSRRDLIRKKQKGGVTFLEPLNAVVPDNLDWREKGFVTPVKDQRSCGSCWAFSATGSLEGQHKRKYGKLISLSEQNLIDCTWEYGNSGCSGGFKQLAFEYVIENDGIDTEESYPYKGVNGKCSFLNKTIGATAVGYMNIAYGNEKLMKTAVATMGPVSVAIDATENFRFYKEGIFFDKTCSSDEYDLNHEVLVVGYGSKDRKDYWIVKNSWGKWGEDGYILMSRNRNNNCGIASDSSIPLI